MIVGSDNAIYVQYATGKVLTTRKYSAAGEIKWDDTFTSALGVNGMGLALQSDGSLFVAGSHYLADNFYVKTYVIQISPNGVRRSMDTYSFADDRSTICSGIAFNDARGTAYVAGYTSDPYHALLDNSIFTLKY